MIKYNQYYTSKNISDLVTTLISISQPLTCLELSAGEGALLDSAKKKWPHLHCTTFDIDAKNIDLLREKFPEDLHYCVDATSEICRSLLKTKKFDIAVCNPPFSFIDIQENTKEYLNAAFGSIYSKSKKIRSEILFLALNLLALKDNGIVAIIVPELIIKGFAHEKIRRVIAKNLTIQYLIECEHKSFSKTEAKTFVLILKKTPSTKDSYFKYIKVNEFIEIIVSEQFMTNVFIGPKKRSRESTESRYQILRGRLSGKECKKIALSYIHTTNMADDMCDINFKAPEINPENKTAIMNDILIARVGSRIVGKTNFVYQGNAIISDCIFAVRFQNEADRVIFINYWKKNRDEWISKNCTGTCAKHITIANLSLLIDSILSSTPLE
ncbi:TPA: N-6 DNA methylase [Enterobacter roggenkampii]|uniref:N-6 DNA methylase n=1 Tax=Enterobacter roggenkampii TaxID=1812935 RepID=UPI0006DB206E|nr:N-6 DNA methylase [Enterobacter roggenkampii]OEG95645.1 hypothetical protein AN685_0223470 [Enterobacter roggenkampii]HAS0804688.1 N-6 DNA methylase [Enterobacter roggenkampii]HAT7722668.1 N-6 DNA methylase [Enterobacter roggenkampii]HDT6073667.1 N-6 DNA methylase [Enterobacter roggenkampii]